MSESISLTLLSGTIAAILFTTSNIPMLLRAIRTKDLRSYSLAHFVVSNLANGFYWIYIITLPFGPIWLMHGFYTISAALMLLWDVRYRKKL
jgi:uncharacterized protein with PQ loop repeat